MQNGSVMTSRGCKKQRFSTLGVVKLLAELEIGFFGDKLATHFDATCC